MSLPEPPGAGSPIHTTQVPRNAGDFPLVSDTNVYRGQKTVQDAADRVALSLAKAPEGTVCVQLNPPPATEYIRQSDGSWVLHNTGGGGGGDLSVIPLGVPTDGDYDEGLLPLQPTDLGADAIDAINQALAAIAPSQPGDLNGLALVLAGTTLYSAKLPSGLGATWSPYTPGATIANLILDPTYTLDTPNPGTRFNDGQTTQTEGDAVHVENGSDVATRDIANGVGVTGSIEILDVATFNAIWRKVNARVNKTQIVEGRIAHKVRHDPDTGPSDESLETVLYWDDVNTPPSFSVAPGVAVITELTRFLSGIQYYREGTQLDVSYTAASGIFEKAYHPTAVALVDVPSATQAARNPGSTPAVLDTFPDTAPITLLASNVAALGPQATVTLQKPDGTQAQSTANLLRGINTYSSPASTDTTDAFVDEARRLDVGTSTPFTSTAALPNGEAQVRNGQLVHGADGDYPGHTGDDEYDRKIENVVLSGGTVRWTGILASDIDPEGTGDLNALLQLETDGVWFDLGLDFGLSNGDGSGSTPANSIGAKISAAGGDLSFSLGTYSTGNNGNEMRLRIRFRGANGQIITRVEVL